MAIRSPGYPAIDLEQAIDKARIMYQHDKRSSTSSAVLASHWGYSAASSGGKLATAALKKFGLLEAVGNMKSGEVKLTPLALEILLDEREHSPDRERAIKRAALNPDLHAELWSKWGHELPSDATVKTYLRLQRGFNDASVGDFLREYKQTISFAKLVPDDKIPEDDSAAIATSEPALGLTISDSIRVGAVAHGNSQSRLSGVQGNVLNLPFPLIGGGFATLSVPIPLSAKNYAYLVNMVKTTL